MKKQSSRSGLKDMKYKGFHIVLGAHHMRILPNYLTFSREWIRKAINKAVGDG